MKYKFKVNKSMYMYLLLPLGFMVYSLIQGGTEAAIYNLIFIAIIVIYSGMFVFNSKYELKEDFLKIRYGFFTKRIEYSNIKEISRGALINRARTSMSNEGIILKLHEPYVFYNEVVISSLNDDDLESDLRRKCNRLDDIFEYELAPFLGSNHLTVAGEWAMFDEKWVCEEAEKKKGRKKFWDWLMAKTGFTTYAARPAWNKVKKVAFKKEANVKD